MLIVILAIATPVIYLVVGAFHEDQSGVAGGTLTWANIRAVYGSAQYLSPLRNSVALGVAVAILAVVLGGALAWICERTDAPGRGWLGALIPVPILIAPLVTSLAWIAIAAPNAGFLNAIVHAVIPSVNSLFTIYSFAGVVLVLVLHLTPYAYLGIRAALATLDPSLEEASTTLGVGKFRTAWRMTLPLVAPAVITSGLLVFVFAVEDFSAPSLLGTPAGFTTVPSEIYLDVANGGLTGQAATAGSLLLWLAVIGLALQRRITAKAGRYRSISGKPGMHRAVSLGPWRPVATAVGVLYLMAALIGPYCALVYGSLLRFVTPHITRTNFTLGNYSSIVNPENIDALRNTIELALVGSAAAIVTYTLIAFILTRTSWRLRRLLDYATVVPFALPGIVVGIGFLWAFVSLPPMHLYGTVFGLGVVYIVRYMGLGVQQLKSAAVQVTPDLEAAARLAGAGRLRAFITISLPLLLKAIRATWAALIVLFSLEVSSTILLYSPTSRTLPVLIWNDAAENPTGAFAIAALQVTAVFIILALGAGVRRQRDRRSEVIR